MDVLGLIATAATSVYLAGQVRKPDRFGGRLIAWTMNRSHSSLTDWGLEAIAVRESDAILDVGCGGGRTIQKLSALAPRGVVCGLDYATGSVAASKSFNLEAVQAGRVRVELGSISKAPYADGEFDLVTAVETVYYWPDIALGLREVERMLKPGGRFLMIAESYRGANMDWLMGRALALVGGRRFSVEETERMFKEARFTGIAIETNPAKGWIRASGMKEL